ncbi:GNAT family N-acetyltransferase [Parasphingopyxis lamellibrachiae]|uniref:Putative N-acetyltransferase YhbS n=1 Tax=Parasphingopyxis lamellibrachiae TaxID=680125 RepID=A0A3D9FEX6_9SPHN|nr:GNAT family N-acetyltransferase [Parasphingopyxis lamellibrachiae]RED16385.1 putative N-acetyltransferase YhbS [Parasphingopyxis lamellibrachiae]
MAIRPAEHADIRELAAIELSASELFRGTVMEFAMDDPPLDRATLERALLCSTLWVAEHEGECAGFLCATPLERLLYIDELAVASEYQGHGLGRALMETGIKEARGRFDRIALTTDRELAWNGPFYARLGFEEWPSPPAAITAELEEEIAHGFDAGRRCAMQLGLS